MGAPDRGAVAEGRRAARRDARSRPTRRDPRRRDAAIVTPRPVLRVGLDKTGLSAGRRPPTRRAGWRSWSTSTPRPSSSRSTAAGPKAFVQAIVYRRSDVPGRGARRPRRHPGCAARSPTSCRSRPTKDFAAAILGTRRAGDRRAGQGQQGTDQGGRRRRPLRPAEEVRRAAGRHPRRHRRGRRRQGHQRRTLFTADAEARLRAAARRSTSRPQNAAQKALADVGPASALVAIRPSTGDIVAVASGPGSKGYNTATYGQYAPGSTFKVVSALALLRAGVSPSTTASTCTPTTVVDGKTVQELRRLPVLGARRRSPSRTRSPTPATPPSSPSATSWRPTSLAPTRPPRSGLGVDHDTGFPAFFGKVGPPDSETQAAASMIGQGTVLASPMAMATVVASVLKGSAVLPRLLPDVKVEPKQPAKPLTAAEARQLRAMMRAVVERGSGARCSPDLPGGPVIAKTGTAEFGDKPPLPDARVDGRRPRRPRRRRLRRARRVRVGDRRPGARAVPARGPMSESTPEGRDPHLPPGRPGQPAATPTPYGAGAASSTSTGRMLLFSDSDPGLPGRALVDHAGRRRRARRVRPRRGGPRAPRGDRAGPSLPATWSARWPAARACTATPTWSSSRTRCSSA